MTKQFTLQAPVECRPLEAWPSVADLLKSSTARIVEGQRFQHYVIEAGDPTSPALVLIHGIGGHAETWARNMDVLAEHFHVIAIDAVYHGRSSHEPFVSNIWFDLMGVQAAGVYDLVTALGHKKAIVAGESMGAGIAFEYAYQYPDACLGVVLNTGFGLVPPTRTDFKPQSVDMGALGTLSRAVMTDLSFDNMRARMEWLVAEPDRMTDEMVQVRLALYRDKEIFAAMERVYGADWNALPQRSEADCANISVPTLVFWTDLNPGEGPDVGEYYADLLPAADFYSMADAAHWPQWEKPEEHDAVMIQWARSAGLI